MYPATFTFPPIVATALLEAAVTSAIGGCSTLAALLKLVDHTYPEKVSDYIKFLLLGSFWLHDQDEFEQKGDP